MEMKQGCKNIIMIMSGGIGARFGADCPKQYNYMSGRPVIDYVVDASKRSIYVDEIIIVASEDYINYVKERYNVPTVVGGSTRPESVANGVKFIHENYDCEKLIITNAVCPLATSEQYDRYFDFLDRYDYVLTTWKLAPALHMFSGQRVDRDDFFNIMEPDAYRFSMLYENFDFLTLKKYIFHNMPEDANAYFCFDYPYTTKVTYQFDIPVLEVLYENLINKSRQENVLQKLNKYLSSDGSSGIENWISDIQIQVKELVQTYHVLNYNLNAQTQANIIYEGESSKYGDIVMKFFPSDEAYEREFTYYQETSGAYMAELIGKDVHYRAIILKKVKPGIQVKFHPYNDELRLLYDTVARNFIPAEKVLGNKLLPKFIDEFEDFSIIADRHRFEYDYRKVLKKKVKLIWNYYFACSDMYYLHGDMQRRNILSENGQLRVIDPRGTIGPKEFEYTIQFITELREDIENKCLSENFNIMMEYFKRYVEEERLMAALFIFWVHKLNDYIFHKNDNYRLASWCKSCIQKLFFHDSIENAMNPEYMPDGVEIS